MTELNPEVELVKVQRDQFAYYIVQIAIALGGSVANFGCVVRIS
jgi:hypothetical protein